MQLIMQHPACLVVISLCLLASTDSFQLQTLAECSAWRKNKRGTYPTPLFLSEPAPPEDDGSEKQKIFVMVDEDDEQDDTLLEHAKTTAAALGVPLFSNSDVAVRRESRDSFGFTHALSLVPYEYGTIPERSTFALAIEPMESSSGSSRRRPKKKKPKTNKPSSAAFFVDLCPPVGSRAGRRAAGASGTSDLLVKAVGPRKGSGGAGAVVWDLTAGLGQDSLVLARNGARRVHMVERNPVVAALLGDAMRRLEWIASQEASLDDSDGRKPATALLETLSLTIGEGKDELRKREGDRPECDVVYLDPMFPPRQKKSAVKKGMSILHGLLETHVRGDEIDEDQKQREEQELLVSAIDVATLRVVVKRPVNAPPLGDGSKKPSYVVAGSTNRWDVYVSPVKT